MGIVVSVKLPECDLVDFEQKLESLLRSYGACINTLSAADGHKLIRAYREIEQTIAAEPEVATSVATIELPADIPAPAVELPPEPPVELPALDPIPAEVPSIEPAPEVPPAPAISGEVCLKDLSSFSTVPFFVDHSLECSELKVKNLIAGNEYVSFAYCDMTFTVPVATPSYGDVRNTNPQYVGACIRSICSFPGFEADFQPILFKLTNASEDSGCSVVFGSDVADVVARIMEKVPSNDSLSTK